MDGLLMDNNVEGHVRILERILESSSWRELWRHLQIPIISFADAGLDPKTVDAVVWRHCQDRRWVLITANRNKKDDDSLESVIETENNANCLPVLTLADAEQIRHSKTYAERVVEQLLTYLHWIDNYRGTGRLYLT
mgnify:FL=1